MYASKQIQYNVMTFYYQVGVFLFTQTDKITQLDYFINGLVT